MPKYDHERLSEMVDNAGILKGLSYTPASTTRGEALSIKLGRDTDRVVTRTLTIKDKHFDDVFDEAVLAVAEWRKVKKNDPLIAEMLKTREAFMAYYGLTYKHVKIEYTTVEQDPNLAKSKGPKRKSRHETSTEAWRELQKK